MPDAAPTGASPLWRKTVSRLYERCFGRLPETTPWHPYHAMLQPARRALAMGEGPVVLNILVISSAGVWGPLLARPLRAAKLTITPAMLGMAEYDELIFQRPKFDLCLCDLNADDLLRFRDMLAKIRPAMTERSKVVVFHHNAQRLGLDDLTFEFTKKLFPLTGRSRVSFAGSALGARAERWYARILRRYSMTGPVDMAVAAFLLALCSPVARAASVIEARRPPHVLPRPCTSMTLEIELGPAKA